MTDNRIEILKDILLDLHHGASPEAVQERFDKTFKGVSALEISLMEHELMSDEKSGVTFEDVMDLCDVHANLFKNAVEEVEVADADHLGHPVYVFKQENLALRGALLRIRRILDNLDQSENEDFQADIIKGLKHQLTLLGQFQLHYQRKEDLFFPIMEAYGHDSPPRVMWGVDDEIRDLFKKLEFQVNQLPDVPVTSISQAFEAFAHEFEEMIFKEESILLMILLEIFTQDDWLKIAEESDAIGYAIVRPEEKWLPKREDFEKHSDQTEGQGSAENLAEQAPSEYHLSEGQEQVIDTPAGQFKISFIPKARGEEVDRHTPQKFTNGYLSLEQANLILDHLPLEVTFVNKDDIFQYYNNSVPAQEMIFKRSPSQIGRHVELCHPPKVLDKVKRVFELLKSGQQDKVTMWFKSQKRGQFVYVTYAAVRDQAGHFQGVLEYVQDIQPFFELEGDNQRDIIE
ncbi:DUF438 domain-containing protein [Streptococcus tangpeifui]|uniref:DUF438 domain-containing protein n=1 Tax=Streptococcus tangpeifui TaxID=2709400 RepID=UPI0037DA5C45